MRKLLLPLTVMTVFLALEAFSRHGLFSFVSYFNYDAIDWQMESLAAEDKVDVVFLGSSEVRYGLNPEDFDSTVAHSGHAVSSFNLGIDGMNLTFYRILLPYLYPRFANKGVRYAVIGMNLSEDVTTLPDWPRSLDCANSLGILQMGVFTSPFGIDTGLARTCQAGFSTRVVDDFIFWPVRSLRQRKALRKFLLQPGERRMSRAALKVTERGFHVRPHTESGPALDGEFSKWWQDEGRLAAPLDKNLWTAALSRDGVYWSLADFLKRQGVMPIFVSLPTNPRMIDMLKRRETYAERSRSFALWASDQGVEFVDLGIKDDYDPIMDFADRRHLSHVGAKKFSTELAQDLLLHHRLR